MMISSQHIDNQVLGEELNQLARYLFDSAANKWYAAIGLEVIAALFVAVLGLLDLSGDFALFSAVAGFLLLVVAYALRQRYAVQYDVAETMRRQSLLSEALNWPISKMQMSEWRQKAGKQIRTRVKLKPRASDYYSTKKVTGPERMAEMIIESAFYTRHLYRKLQFWIWTIFTGALIISFLVMSLALTKAIPDSVDLLIARFLYSVIPVVLTIDLFGWGLKLGGLSAAIEDIEAGLEQLCGTQEMDLPRVMRLVSEYNCQVVGGIPIHNWLFSKWSPEIWELWQQRKPC